MRETRGCRRYGRSDYRAFLAMKNAIDRLLSGVRSIEISCPLGTLLTGSAAFSGQIALAGYLTSTGSKTDHPTSVKISEPIFAEIESGRILGFSGDPCIVETVANHHKFVSDTFQIDSDVVHSWHAGIHPGCIYRDPVSVDPDRWSNNVFTRPRFFAFPHMR